MSRIDEALRRLTGAPPVEPRTSHSLDRYASEGVVSRKADDPRTSHSLDRYASEGVVSRKADDPRQQASVESRRLATVVRGPAPVEPRAVPIAPVATAAAVEAEPPHHLQRVTENVVSGDEVEKLVDLRQVANYTGFVVGAVRRHTGIAASAFLTVVLVVALAALLLPRTYHVQVQLLAQRNAVMTALSNPGRAVPWDADAPTRAAAETVLRRDNLISLITQTDLINEWNRRRSPLARLKDWTVATTTRYTPTPDDKLDALVRRLEDNMHVTAGPVGDGTVTIELYWPDAEMAYRLVESARQAFLQARQEAETSAIAESISILEGYSATLHEKVNKTLTDLAQSRGPDAPRAPRTTVVARPRRPAPAVATFEAANPAATAAEGPSPNPEVARLAAQLRDKQDQLSTLETQRQRDLSEAQATLAALKTAYTAQHPSVQNAQQKLDSLQAVPPPIATLKAQVEELEIKYEAVSTADGERMEAERAKLGTAAPTPLGVAAADPAPAGPSEPSPSPPRINPATEFANLTFRTELGQLQSILERTDGAKIELAVSEAAFKYRYTVIKPAQVPREPESPNLRLLAMAGLLAAILCSLGAAVAKDLISNRVVEAWQVERQLGLPILGSVRLA